MKTTQDSLKSTVKTKVMQSPRKLPEKSEEQMLYEKPIENIEQERLNKVFQKICGGNLKGESKIEIDDNKDAKQQSVRDCFDKKDLIRILAELKFPFSKPEVELWIWQVDEDLDGCINRYQFILMYKRCIYDKNGLQPRNLFNLVQFLMYDQTQMGTISVQDTLQLIFVRYKDQLEQNIKSIFGDQEKTPDGLERRITFEEYLKQIHKKDLGRKKEIEEARKAITAEKNVVVKKK